MKNLELTQMEEVNGGGWLSCSVSVIGFASAAVGLATLTVASGGLAIAAAAVGFSVAPTAVGLSCFADM